MALDEIREIKIKKLKKLKDSNINPYPSKLGFAKDLVSIKEALENYKDWKGEEGKIGKTISLAGRMMAKREHGGSVFFDISDGTSKIQVYIKENILGKDEFKKFQELIDIGDFVEILGALQDTKKQEKTLYATNSSLLSKALLPLPEKWHGLQDEEEKLRKRYLDILMDSEIKEMFVRKSKFWQAMRNFLLKNDFMEVETPVLEISAGGAAATPFKTHHNALDMDVFLRISMGELWQKKLMIAGYPKTFEIGRQFRNEGMDADHLQDYTQMEFYWAYANYENGMKLVQDMYRDVAKKTFDKLEFERSGHKFNLLKDWEKIDYSTEIKKQTDINIFEADKKEIANKLKELKQEFDLGLDKTRLIDILWKYCRKNIPGPAFLVGQPVEIAPLAKRNSKDPRKVEQFQVILAGSEVGNGYSELNDPLDQEERFKEQQKMKDKGDHDAQSHDRDFVEALEYGMPPTCGFGVSERLFSFLEGKPIRETVFFPLMKPRS